VKHGRVTLLMGIALALDLTVGQSVSSAPGQEQNWTHRVRIAGYGLGRRAPADIVTDAADSHVFGIEVDNDITGRYESFLDPAAKLADIRALAAEAHKAGNRAFVYIAGTECITKDADSTPHTLAKEHPDWLQRKRTGEPAIFTGGAAFWIRKGDEDVWISPYAMAWREQYMARVRQIAATGIDGIYVDIPYWMTHFDGWQDSWASFDDHTVEAFRRKTGLDARRDVTLGNFSDPHFRQWIDFRIETITGFMAEIDRNAKAVNPGIMTIPEIYPGIERAAVVVGADVYQLYGVTDAIAHEYSIGSGNHVASARTPLDWFRYQVGMRTFRAFAQGKASWILNYSWDGDKAIAPPEPMMNLAMSVVMAGANFWDAATHVMSGTNDLATRKRIFEWIEKYEQTLYAPRVPMHPIGVYFSPATRNYFPDEFIPAYQEIVIHLMQAHRELQIVTPRTLDAFRGSTLILPHVRVLGDPERAALQSQAARGTRLITTGADVAGLARPSSVEDVLAALPDQDVRIDASTAVVTEVARVSGKAHIFFANFAGLVGGQNAVQTPQKDIRVSVPAAAAHKAWFLPFLGEAVEVQGHDQNGRLVFVLPEIQKGAIVWLE
jgi:hypothetical protein